MEYFDARTGPFGSTLYVSHETEKGEKGPFLVAYDDEQGMNRWGYFCTNCQSFDNAMDTMGRLQCNHCANYKKPDEWDAAHE
jgi:hypothetical protein